MSDEDFPRRKRRQVTRAPLTVTPISIARFTGRDLELLMKKTFMVDADNHLGFIMIHQEATFADARGAIESAMIPDRLAADLKWLFYIPGTLASHMSKGQEAAFNVLSFLTAPSDWNAHQDGTSQLPLILILCRAPKQSQLMIEEDLGVVL